MAFNVADVLKYAKFLEPADLLTVLALVAKYKDKIDEAIAENKPSKPVPAPAPAPAPPVTPVKPDPEPGPAERVVSNFRLKFSGAVERNQTVPDARFRRKLAREEKFVPGTRIRIDASPLDQFGNEIGPPGNDAALHELLTKLLLFPDGVTPRLAWRIEDGPVTNITQGEHFRRDGSVSYGCTPAVKVPDLAPGTGVQETGKVFVDYSDPVTGTVRTFGPVPPGSLLCGRADE